MTTRFTRRRFLKTGAAAAGLGYFYTAPATSAVRAADGPTDKVRLGCIGIGGKGDSDSSQSARICQVAAICDTDESRLAQKANQADKRAKDDKDSARPFAGA